MTINYVPLDKDKHKATKVSLNHNFAHAKDTHLAAATIREYAQLASAMPIVFVKDPKSENYHSVAMLGTEQNVNLFFQDEKWQAHCVPLNIQRYPFDVRPDGDKLGVFVDENSTNLGAEGEALFTEEGEAAPFLENRQKLLSDLANSEMVTQRFIKKLVEFDLLDTIQLHIQYVSGQKRNVTGMYGISEKRLQALEADQVMALHKEGFLGAVYAVLMSLGQLNNLVKLSANGEFAIQNMQLRIADPEADKAAAAAAEKA